MYYLHLFDGSRLHIGSVIVVSETSDAPSMETKLRDIGTGQNQFMTKSWTLGPVSTHNEAEVLALAIAARYNYDVMIDGELRRLPQEYAHET